MTTTATKVQHPDWCENPHHAANDLHTCVMWADQVGPNRCKLSLVHGGELTAPDGPVLVDVDLFDIEMLQNDGSPLTVRAILSADELERWASVLIKVAQHARAINDTDEAFRRIEAGR